MFNLKLRDGSCDAVPQVTVQQVLGRVYVVWVVLHLLPPAQLSVGFPLLLLAWTLTEMIRYSLYAVSLVSTPPRLLTWLRYSFFIPAYPTGVTGEAGLLSHCYREIISAADE